MSIELKELPGWTFDVDELSANVFNVIARDSAGVRFEKSGTDADALLEEAEQYARKVTAEKKSK
jgi:hypothetical protein